MKTVATAYPDRELHVVVDNLSTHTTDEVKAWLAQHPRIAFHFTPTGSSWLNMVEIWFGIITGQAIRRGTFTSVARLTRAACLSVEGALTPADRPHPLPAAWTGQFDRPQPLDYIPVEPRWFAGRGGFPGGTLPALPVCSPPLRSAAWQGMHAPTRLRASRMSLLAQWGYPEPGELGPREQSSLLGRAVELLDGQQFTIAVLAAQAALPPMLARTVVDAATEHIPQLRLATGAVS